MNDRETKDRKLVIEDLMEIQAIAQDLEMLLLKQKKAMLKLQGLLRGGNDKKGES